MYLFFQKQQKIPQINIYYKLQNFSQIHKIVLSFGFLIKVIQKTIAYENKIINIHIQDHNRLKLEI